MNQTVNTNIVLATSNPGKLNEFRQLFADTSLNIRPQFEWNIIDADETGKTFIENALIKARHAALYTGLAAIADDSGLVITALNDAPGVYSARYAGAHGDHLANTEKVLKEMCDVPIEQRAAYFQCCLAYVTSADDPNPIICEAKWHGYILTEKQGHYGFGYDPIFAVPEYNCSAAELDSSIKNKISHRGQALQLLLERLRDIYKI